MDIINGRWKQPKHGEMAQDGQAWGVPGGGIKVSCLMMDVWERWGRGGHCADWGADWGHFYFFPFLFALVFLAVRRLPLVSVSWGYSPVVM